MAALAGRKALVKVSGTSTSFTDEACSTVTANTVYQITSTTKQVWDRSATITVKKDGSAQASTLYTLNRLTGKITFLSDIGSGHTITVSGNYLPLSTAAQAKSYSYSLKASNLNVSKFGDTWVPRIQGLKDVSGSLSDFKADTYFTDALVAGVPIVIEFWSDSSASYDLRVWALLNQAQVSSALTDAVTRSVAFDGATDVDLRSISG